MKHFKTYSKNSLNYIEIYTGKRDVSNVILTDKNIICSTYESADIVKELLNRVSNYLLIIDEFHNLSTSDLNTFHLINKSAQCIFVSATPKYLDGINYGIKYEFSWKEAIENKFICNFNFYFPNNIEITKAAALIDNKLVVKNKLLEKAFFVLNNIKLIASKKMIIFLKSVDECEEFNSILKYVNYLFKMNLRIATITYLTKSSERELILSNFQKKSTFIEIVTSVHVLDEGIDIPKCDSVFITNPNHNILNIIQRISRCNRLDTDRPDKIGNVFLWSKNKEKLDTLLEKINKHITICSGINDNYNVQLNKLENKTEMVHIAPRKEINQNKKDDFIKYINEINTDNKFNNFAMNFYFDEETELIVDFDKVCIWLGSRKDTIKDTLVRTYVEKVDYIIEKTKAKHGGVPVEKITITPACMKKICMGSRTEKSDEVKNYFVKIEGLLKKYQSDIIDALQKRIKILENNQKKYSNPSKGVIYVFHSPLDPDDMFKLGSTKRFRRRVVEESVTSADNLEEVLVYETDFIREVEACIKGMLLSKQYRKRKEMFQVDIDIIKEVIAGCDELAYNLNRKKKIKVNDGKKIKKSEKLNSYVLVLDEKQINDLKTKKKTSEIKNVEV